MSRQRWNGERINLPGWPSIRTPDQDVPVVITDENSALVCTNGQSATTGPALGSGSVLCPQRSLVTCYIRLLSLFDFVINCCPNCPPRFAYRKLVGFSSLSPNLSGLYPIVIVTPVRQPQLRSVYSNLKLARSRKIVLCFRVPSFFLFLP